MVLTEVQQLGEKDDRRTELHFVLTHTKKYYSKHYSVFEPYYSKVLELICCGNITTTIVIWINYFTQYCTKFSTTIEYIILQYTTVYHSKN